MIPDDTSPGKSDSKGTAPTMRLSRVGFRYLRLQRLRESLLPLASTGSGSPSGRCDVSLIVPSTVAEEFSYVNSYLFDANPKAAKFFVCKSNCEENVYIALRFGVWSPSSLEFLSQLKKALMGHPSCAAADTESPPVYIFFSVSGSGMFLGMCQLIGVNESVSLRWPDGIVRRGAIMLKWIFVHDIPNTRLEHLLVQMAHCPSNREPQPLPQCREGQEVPLQKGKEIMKIFRHAVRHGGVSLLDDVTYYDKKFRKFGMDLDGFHQLKGSVRPL